jgi:hypothetical protein
MQMFSGESGTFSSVKLVAFRELLSPETLEQSGKR